MSKSRTSLIIVSVIMILAFTFSSALAGSEPPVADEAPIAVDAGPATSPVSPKDNETIFDKYTRYHFWKAGTHTDTMKYRVKVWNYNTDELMYTLKGIPGCATAMCWFDPVIPLKYVDLAGKNGLYYWTVEAKTGVDWSLPSNKAYFRVISPGFYSSFDTLKKWQVLRGPWTTVTPGFLTTETKPDKFFTVIQKHEFTTDYQFEVRMKRKGEIGKGNYIIINGYPYDGSKVLPEDSWDDGYMIGYNNIGYWFIYKRMNGSEAKLAPNPSQITPAVLPYKWNKITVYVHEKMIYLWINQQYVGKVYDEFFFPSGWVGIGVGDSATASSPIFVDWAELKHVSEPPYPMD